MDLPIRAVGESSRDRPGSASQHNYQQSGTGNTQNNIGSMHIHDNEPEDKAAILKWLKPSNPRTDHAAARLVYHPGTGSWLLRQHVYKEWNDGNTQHIWAHGKAGRGKTVICYAVVEDMKQCILEQPDTCLAYFYFTFSDKRKQRYEDLIASIISQLEWTVSVRIELRRLPTSGSQTSVDELEEVLLLAVAPYKKVFLVIDGIDECPEDDDVRVRRSLLKQLANLLKRAPNLKLFALSRPLHDIRAVMEDLDSVQVPFNAIAVNKDIAEYVAYEIRHDPDLREFNPDLKLKVRNHISEHADGMFRWAYLVLEEIIVLKSSRPSAVVKALQELPKDLDTAYAQMMARLTEDDRKSALLMLQFIAYASVDFDDRGGSQDVLKLLQSLVISFNAVDSIKKVIDPADEDCDSNSAKSVREEEKIDLLVRRFIHGTKIGPESYVQLAHFSVKEYLESHTITDGTAEGFRLSHAEAQHSIMQSCLTYLTAYSLHPRKTSRRQDMDFFYLLPYAANAWYAHAALHGDIEVETEVSFLGDSDAMAAWLAFHDPTELLTLDDQRYESPRYQSNNTIGWTSADALFYAVGAGLKNVVRALISDGANTNTLSMRNRSALHAAVAADLFDMVKLLCELGLELDSNPEEYGIVLWEAVLLSRQDIAEHLLKLESSAKLPQLWLDRATDIAERLKLETMSALLKARGGGHRGTCAPEKYGALLAVPKDSTLKEERILFLEFHFGNILWHDKTLRRLMLVDLTEKD